MKKFILTLFLIFFSLRVSAEWTLIGSSVTDDEYYIDLSTKKVNKGIIKIWVLESLKEQDSDGTFVSKRQMEFDCKNDLMKPVYSVFYSDKEMSKVIVSGPSTIKDWRPVVPGSVLEEIKNIVCKK